jgi:hypothetical protein
MPIKLHCDHCGKKIEAPDNAGGKWGKCPGCHNKVYVPEPASMEEPLKLAPIDETEEERAARLRQEALEMTQDILEDSQIPDEPFEPGELPEISERKLNEHIISYLRQMADGDLDNAQRTADLIVPHRVKAIAILDQLARSDAPDPELESIPQQVLSGLIRNLRTRIS